MATPIEANNHIEIGFNELAFLSVVWTSFRKTPKWVDPYNILKKANLTFSQQKPILRGLVKKGIIISTERGFLRGYNLVKTKGKASSFLYHGRMILNREEINLDELFPSNANLVGQAPKENALVNSSKTPLFDPRMTKIGKNGLKLLGAIWNELSPEVYTRLDIETVARKASLNSAQTHLQLQKLVEARFLIRNKTNKFVMEFKKSDKYEVRMSLQPGTHEIEFRGMKYKNGELVDLNDLFGVHMDTYAPI